MASTNVFKQRDDCAVPWAEPYALYDCSSLNAEELNDLDDLFLCAPRLEFPWAVPPPAMPFLGCYIPNVETDVSESDDSADPVAVIKDRTSQLNPCDWRLRFNFNSNAFQPMQYEIKSVTCEEVDVREGATTQRVWAAKCVCKVPGNFDKQGLEREAVVYARMWPGCTADRCTWPTFDTGTKITVAGEFWTGTKPAVLRKWSTQPVVNWCHPQSLGFIRDTLKKIFCTTVPAT